MKHLKSFGTKKIYEYNSSPNSFDTIATYIRDILTELTDRNITYTLVKGGHYYSKPNRKTNSINIILSADNVEYGIIKIDDILSTLKTIESYVKEYQLEVYLWSPTEEIFHSLPISNFVRAYKGEEFSKIGIIIC